ncbi:MAG: hypothetical protein JRG91_00625 [Deltaproteobacteria bacterium]|nr:hypothetical protein [Deltaproteobacteria bacterium]
MERLVPATLALVLACCGPALQDVKPARAAPAPNPPAPPVIVIETKHPQQEAPDEPEAAAAHAPADVFGPLGMPLIDVDGVKVFLGREDDEAVWKAFSAKKDALMKCHLAQLEKDPAARDYHVSLVLVITSDGRIREASAESDPRNPGFEVCILAAVMKMSFAFDRGFVNEDGDAVETTVQYDIPITFTQAD